MNRKPLVAVAALAAFFVLAVGTQAAPQVIGLSLLTEDATTITLGWTPVSGAIGYRFTRSDQSARPHTWDAARSTVKFGRDDSVTYGVQALSLLDVGTYTRQAAPMGTTITVNGQWICDRPLSQYGPLPITVEQTISQPASLLTNTPGAVRMHENCSHTGRDGVPDLILHINGDGNNVGSGRDGLAIRGAHDMDVGGYVNCGKVSAGAHQDGVQTNYAYRLNFIGFTSGNWAAQTATCHGAAGVWTVSAGSSQFPDRVQDVVCDGCRIVGSSPTGGASGRAFILGTSMRSGARNSCFAARIPFTLTAFAQSPVNVNNLFIDTDSASPQPSPSDCQA